MRPGLGITFASFDGKTSVRIGHGDNCVLIEIHQPYAQYAGVVLTADEADRFVRSLRRQVKFSRTLSSLSAVPGTETERNATDD